MKRLQDILYKVELSEVLGSTDLSVASICFDSRKVDKGSLFVAVKGTQVDGHEFIDIAVQQGAAAILVEEFPSETKEHITYVKVKDSSLVLGLVAANFYDNPSEKLKTCCCYRNQW